MKDYFKNLDLRFIISLAIFSLFILLSHEIVQGIKFSFIPKKDNLANEMPKINEQRHVIKEVIQKKEAKKTVKKADTKKAVVAIVVDDLGINFNIVKKISKIGLDFTFSVLPDRTYTTKIADYVAANGAELMLHLPMEPYSYPEDNPGKGALMLKMSNDEIRARFNEILNSMPGIAGVNNHMGSRFCEDYEKMSVVMSAIKNEGLFFLDSKTSNKSAGNYVADVYGVPNASRWVFLDNDKSEKSILKQINRLIKRAKSAGYAIAICHPYPETAAVMKKLRNIFEKNGVEVIRMSKIIEHIEKRKKRKRDKLLTSKALMQQ